MNEMDWLLLLKIQQALNKSRSAPKPSQPKVVAQPMLTFIKESQKGPSQMSGKSMKINDQDVIVESFEANDRGDNIRFNITRTADGGASTNAIVSLFGKSSTVSVVDSDSKVTFTLSDGQISEYRYFTRENQAALEYFKLEGNKIGVK